MTPLHRARGALLLLGSALIAAPAAAAWDCFVNVAGPANFGTYDGTQNDGATAAVSGQCTSTLPGLGTSNPVISLSTGLSGSYVARQMASGVRRLNYNLYTDALRTIVWGNGSAGTATVRAYVNNPPGIFLGTLVFDNPNLTIQGRMPAGQDSGSGNYSDTITLTITF